MSVYTSPIGSGFNLAPTADDSTPQTAPAWGGQPKPFYLGGPMPQSSVPTAQAYTGPSLQSSQAGGYAGVGQTYGPPAPVSTPSTQNSSSQSSDPNRNISPYAGFYAPAVANTPQPTAPVVQPPLSSSSNGQPITGYGVNPPSTIPSTVIGSGLSYNDVLNARNQLMTDYQSDNSKYANDYQNIMGQQVSAQFAGDTTDYGTGMANLVKMESQPVLTADQMRASNALSALQQQQGFAQQLNPSQNQIGPGSTAINPTTGTAAYSGMGAAPSTILSTAQNLASLAQQQGTIALNPDGSINMAPYIQQAQQQLSLAAGQQGNAGSAPGTITVGTPLNQGGVGGYSAPQPGSQQFYNALPATVAPAYRQTSTGQSYFDMSQLDSAGLGTARQISKAYGGNIPILSGDDAKAVQTVDQAQKNLVTLKANFDSLAQNSTAASLAGNLTDPVSQLFQTNYGSALDTYNSNRDALLQQIRALAGMSPRLTNVELNLSQGALPTLTELNKDTVQTGNMKIQTVTGYLNNALSTLIPGAGGQSGQSVGGTLNVNNQGGTTGSPYSGAAWQ
jgi:hypothetical protein